MAVENYNFCAMLGNGHDWRTSFIFPVEVKPSKPIFLFIQLDSLAAHISALRSQVPTASFPTVFYPGMSQFMVYYFYFLVTLTL